MKEKMIYEPKKSKGGAVALAVFFSFWTWLYTYKFDAWKFWLGLVLNVLLFWTIIVPIGIWIWAFIDQCIKHEDLFDNYYNIEIR